jgi:transposase
MAAHIETGVMNSPKYLSQQLDHLGLIAGIIDELELVQLIDEIIPQDKTQRIVSIGQAVKAMVLNGLGFANRALYLTPLFFRNKPTERLIGEGILPEHLHDDLLGRSLDTLYEYGVSKLYPQLAALTVKKLGLLTRFGHLDSTSFHTDGRYNSDADPEEGVVHITKGYSRDHRPDLNQIVLQLINEQQAGIPLVMQVLNGNNSDQVSFHEMIQGFKEQMQETFGLEYMVADSALYTGEKLVELSWLWWITRVPEGLTLAQEKIEQYAPELMINPNEAAATSIEVEYGGVAQRWLIHFSPQAYQRAIKNLHKKWLANSTTEFNRLNKLCKQHFACEADARKAYQQFEKTLKYSFLTEFTIHEIPRFNGKGRPKKDRSPDYFEYQIEAALASDWSTYNEQLRRKSCFILATNQLDTQALTDDELFKAYKEQQKVERGFRFLKDPMFMASTFYLNSPKRIEALMMVMTLSLLIYAALEHRIREALQSEGATFQDQKGQATQRPTARWVFQYFTGIHVLQINKDEYTQYLVLNLREAHMTLLRCLGERYLALYTDFG